MTNKNYIHEIEEILEFWFEKTSTKQKFTKDEKFDSLIREKYLDLYWRVVNRETTDWEAVPEGILAEIVVLDQFSRNMFRGDKQSFAEDALALELAEKMVEKGLDKKISLEKRSAIYMPYMHSESREVHEKALEIFKKFAKESSDNTTLEYELKHKSIIDKFGRYPHRNEVLGRESTPEEITFNNEHGGF
jgi:uncharacterized protein (DUF924 family)